MSFPLVEFRDSEMFATTYKPSPLYVVHPNIECTDFSIVVERIGKRAALAVGFLEQACRSFRFEETRPL